MIAFIQIKVTRSERISNTFKQIFAIKLLLNLKDVGQAFWAGGQTTSESLPLNVLPLTAID